MLLKCENCYVSKCATIRGCTSNDDMYDTLRNLARLMFSTGNRKSRKRKSRNRKAGYKNKMLLRMITLKFKSHKIRKYCVSMTGTTTN